MRHLRHFESKFSSSASGGAQFQLALAAVRGRKGAGDLSHVRLKDARGAWRVARQAARTKPKGTFDLPGPRESEERRGKNKVIGYYRL